MRAAQATAMNRLIKAANKVEVDPEAIHKLLVTNDDFQHALQHDIKPVNMFLQFCVVFMLGFGSGSNDARSWTFLLVLGTFTTFSEKGIF